MYSADLVSRLTLDDSFHLLVPKFYCEDSLTPQDIQSTKQCWHSLVRKTMLINNEEYHGLDYFSVTLFDRVFDISPSLRRVFGSQIKKKKFLDSFFSFSFSALDDPVVFESQLKYLARYHFEMGIRSNEYGIVCDSILWALPVCLGDLATDCLESWARLFSRILYIIVRESIILEISMYENSKMD